MTTNDPAATRGSNPGPAHGIRRKDGADDSGGQRVPTRGIAALCTRGLDGGSEVGRPNLGSGPDEARGASLAALAEPLGPALSAGFGEVERELPEADFRRLRQLLGQGGLDRETLRDGLSTQLMDLYRLHQARSCFALLYELNRAPLLQQVAQRLRRYSNRSDPNDLLQEVFFNIYRYPSRFDCARDDAFRVWTATIVRNTVLKHLRSLARSGRAEVPFEDLSEHPESDARGPVQGVLEAESERECRQVYLYHLHFYFLFYLKLSPREQRALQLVEVDGVSYRDAADALGIRLENLKMVVFRARRKIYKAMRRVYDGLAADVRPARAPLCTAASEARSVADPGASVRSSGQAAANDREWPAAGAPQGRAAKGEQGGRGPQGMVR